MRSDSLQELHQDRPWSSGDESQMAFSCFTTQGPVGQRDASMLAKIVRGRICGADINGSCIEPRDVSAFGTSVARSRQMICREVVEDIEVAGEVVLHILQPRSTVSVGGNTCHHPRGGGAVGDDEGQGSKKFLVPVTGHDKLRTFQPG
jgi:hypothetical protein